jgi:hypothetical protein
MMNTSACGNNLHGKWMSGRFSKTKLAACLSIPLMAAILQGCTGGTIQGISGQIGALDTPSHFKVLGDGVCGKVRIDFGDGSAPADVANYDFANTPAVTHTYTGWGGKKTVKAGSLENCVGTAQKIFSVAPVVFSVGYKQPRPSACDPVPNQPPLRKNTKVHITTNPDPNVRIDFGCPFGNCVYDADGMNSTVPLPPGYPFPALRPLSLVLRVGSQAVQGGTDVTFTTTQAGLLEICVNDYNLSDNTGAWGVFIEVDDSAAQ